MKIDNVKFKPNITIILLLPTSDHMFCPGEHHKGSPVFNRKIYCTFK